MGMSIVSSEAGIAELEDEVVDFFSRGASFAPSKVPFASRFLRLSRLFLFALPFWVERSLFIFEDESFVGEGVVWLASIRLLGFTEALRLGGVEDDAAEMEGLRG